MPPRVIPELTPRRRQRVMAAATELIWAVRCGDRPTIDRALDRVTKTPGGLRVLVLVLAAMAPDDESPAHMLGWLDNPAGYLRLREQGLSRTEVLDVLDINRGRATQ